MIENQMIRDSVDLTVEKLRFSLVRKYFWLRARENQLVCRSQSTDSRQLSR